MRQFLILWVLLILPSGALAQGNPAKWWIQFSDKNHSPYCTCRPAEFLSARALDRRAKAGISIVENDLPVNPGYVQALRNAGAVLHGTSRWLNAASVIADSATIRTIARLPFVDTVVYVGRDIKVKNPPNRAMKQRVSLAVAPTEGPNYAGYAARQNNLLGVPLLHALGARGDGIWVAVLDGGFTNADTIPLFDSLALQHRMFQGWDFVEHDAAVFESASHGTGVLSVMAANMPGYFVGTAPAATYFLVKTEDTGGEYPIEECNWISGAEWADSIGADIINASLGYTVFNDTTLGHRWHELDGRRTIGARGASIAATKGMIICNSAGNSGDEDWKKVGVPADAPGIVAVGAVDYNKQRAVFSSFGPTADGRIKPDLMAPGDRVVTAAYSGIDLGLSSGTSLASPMLAGAIASLWSAYPDKTGKEILDAVYASADQITAPNNARGYGLPDMSRAWFELGDFHLTILDDPETYIIWARDPKEDKLILYLTGDQPSRNASIGVHSALGLNPNLKATWNTSRWHMMRLEISGINGLPAGAYQLNINDGLQTWNMPFALVPKDRK
ncbi:MAG: S8 family serine peptidase [Lewinellaceae bacterium]|nr:S8 family serine peptidase [Lewinellaceae bacterium]